MATFARTFGVLVSVSFLLAPRPLAAQPFETGDFDGDGRLTIRDVFERFVELPAAPGSLDGFDAYPCSSSSTTQAGAVQLEALRRSIPDSLPHWYAVWPPGAGNGTPTLPLTELVSVEVLDSRASGGAEDELELRVFVTTFVPVRAFWLVLETDREDDVLRVPFASSNSAQTSLAGCCDHIRGASELFVQVSNGAFLITNGRFVISHGFWSDEPVPPGTYTIATLGRLKRGTPSGDYALRLHPSSEVLLEDMTIASPSAADEGAIHVARDVTGGYDGGVPPLRFDPATRAVEGEIEFRVTNAEGLPGETVQVKVQMRTEVPLDQIYLQIPIRPGGFLTCPHEPLNLFTDPEEERLYAPSSRHYCNDFNGGIAPYIRLEYHFVSIGRDSESHPRRSLEYFRPLDEWTDIAAVDFTIDECAAGGTEIDLEILAYDPLEAQNGIVLWRPAPRFGPYEPEFPCDFDRQPGHANWRHDFIVHPGKISVLGARPACGDPPPDVGFDVIVGEATGAPGDVVEVPVFARADVHTSYVTLALEVDPAAVAIESVEVDVVNLRDLEAVTVAAGRGGGEFFQDCIDGAEPRCTFSVPSGVIYYDTAPSHVVVVQPVHGGESSAGIVYPGSQLREVARLLVRIRGDFSGFETPIRPAFNVNVPSLGRDDVQTGVFLAAPDLDVFAPARSITSGRIRIAGGGFRRGDANSDQASNLSDAVFTLNFLFLGGPSPDCEDAADSDDSGRLELTDAVYLLNALFLGTGPLPEPHPGCGGDPSQDDLSCEGANCE